MTESLKNTKSDKWKLVVVVSGAKMIETGGSSRSVLHSEDEPPLFNFSLCITVSVCAHFFTRFFGLFFFLPVFFLLLCSQSAVKAQKNLRSH